MQRKMSDATLAWIIFILWALGMVAIIRMG